MTKNLTFHKQAVWYVKHEILRFATKKQSPSCHRELVEGSRCRTRREILHSLRSFRMTCHHEMGFEPFEVDRS